MANGWWAGANNAVWTTLSNWRNSETSGTQPASIPGTASSDIAYFQNNGIGGQSRTIYLNTASRSLAQINVNVQARTTVLAGGASGAPAAQTINLGASGIDLSTGTFATLTFDSNARIALTSSQIWNTGPSGTGVTVQSIISGSGFGITKQGASDLNLSGTNTFTGNITVSAGVFRVNGASGALGSWSYSGLISVASGSIFTYEGNTTQILAGVISGAGDVYKYNTLSALNLSATNTYTGQTRVAEGTFRVYGGGTLGSGSYAGNIIISSGAEFTYESTAAQTLSGVISGSGTLYKFNSASTLTLTGTSTFSGPIQVRAGTLTLGSAGTIGSGSFSGTIEVRSGAVLSIDTSANQTLSGVISNAGSLSKSNTGTLTLTGANTFTGGATINAGTVNLGVAQVGSTSGPLGASGTITLGGGTLQYSAANQHDYSSRFSTAASQQYRCDTNGQNVTWASDLTSSGGTLTKSGTGTLTLTGANTYNGALGTLILEGTLNAGSAQLSTSVGPLGALFANSLRFQNGVLQYSAANTYDYSPYVQYYIGSKIRVDTNGQNVIWSVASLNIDPDLGTTGLEKIGSGKWTIESTVDNSGNTDVTGGTLEIGSPGSLNGLYFGNIAFSNNATLAYASSVNQTLSGTISGAGSITKSNTSTLTITQANTYSGGTTLSQGGLTLGNNSALGTGTFTISGGTVDVTAARSITNALSIGGSFTFAGSNTLTQGTGLITLTASPVITVSASTLTLNAIISGAFALSKAGGGTLTLGAFNTYSGNTTVSDGVLRLSTGGSTGCIRGTVTLTAGSTLETTVTDALGYSSTAANRVTDVSLTGATFNNASSGNQGYYTNFTLNGATVTSTGTGKINFYTGRTITGSGSNTWSAPTRIRTEVSNTLTVSISSGTTTMSGVVSEGNGSGVLTAFTGGLTKTGAGTFALTAANTYRGTTTVSQGTLKASNASALGTGASSVASGATLQALASIGGKLNIGGNLTNSGGTLRIGGS